MPDEPTYLYASTAEAMAESLRRLDAQGARGANAKGGCAFAARDAVNDRDVFCGLGILLPHHLAWNWEQGGGPRNNDVFAPDAGQHNVLWTALVLFHDRIWEPERGVPAIVQMKEVASQQLHPTYPQLPGHFREILALIEGREEASP